MAGHGSPRSPSASHLEAFTQLLDSQKKSPKAGEKTLHISYVKRDKNKTKDFPKAPLQDATLLPEYDQFTGKKVTDGAVYVKGQFFRLQKPKEMEDEVRLDYQLVAELARKQSSKPRLRDSKADLGAGGSRTGRAAPSRRATGEEAQAAAGAGGGWGPLLVGDPSAIPPEYIPARAGPFSAEPLPPPRAVPAQWPAAHTPEPAPGRPPERQGSAPQLAKAPGRPEAAGRPEAPEAEPAQAAPQEALTGAWVAGAAGEHDPLEGGRPSRRQSIPGPSPRPQSPAPRRAAAAAGPGGREEASPPTRSRSPSHAGSHASLGPPAASPSGRHSPGRAASPRHRPGSRVGGGPAIAQADGRPPLTRPVAFSFATERAAAIHAQPSPRPQRRLLPYANREPGAGPPSARAAESTTADGRPSAADARPPSAALRSAR